ncbi:hypothetical protein H1R20_g15655, partial [Candolleomyces eurysporus]
MSDSHASLEDVVMGQNQDDAPLEAPTAKTLLCNRCQMMIFGLNELAPTACSDLFCNHCWTAILRDSERCTQAGCQNALLKKVPMYLAEDGDDNLSRERDIDRQLALESDPSYQRIQIEIGRLKVQTDRQKQQIDEYTRMNGVLNDQVRQAVDRLDGVRNKTNQLKGMLNEVERKTDEMKATNNDLEEQILVIRQRTQVLERLAAWRGQPSSAPA